MRGAFGRAGWQFAEKVTEYGREWLMYRITRRQWDARRGDRLGSWDGHS